MYTLLLVALLCVTGELALCLREGIASRVEVFTTPGLVTHQSDSYICDEDCPALL